MTGGTGTVGDAAAIGATLNTEFSVVGAVGRQGVGKTSVCLSVEVFAGVTSTSTAQVRHPCARVVC